MTTIQQIHSLLTQAALEQLPQTIHQSTPTNIELLPTTSISSINHLLRALEWINLLQSQDHQRPSTILDSFDISNLLQLVTDILSPITSESDIEIVFYHIFHPPPLQNQHQHQLTHHDNNKPRSSQSTTQLTPSTQSDPSQPSSNLYLASDSEGDLRQVLVSADRYGLIIGLICLLRQILHRAKRASTIEIGLHLTPLTHPASSPSPTNQSPQTSPQDPLSICTSWKCVFDISLTAPQPTSSAQTVPCSETNHSSSSPTTQPRTSTSSTSTPSSVPSPSSSSSNPELHHSSRPSRVRIPSNQNSELPLCPEESLSKFIFEKILGMKLSTGRLTSSGHSWTLTGIFPKSSSHESLQLDPQPSGTQSVLSSPEPTVEELTNFAETALKGKKAVFFAAEQSIFAKHITTYLTSWNIDVSHMPYEGVQVSNPVDPSAHSNPITATTDPGTSSNLLGSTVPAASTSTSLSIRSNNFIIIDDNISTLQTQLTILNTPSLSSLLSPGSSLSRNLQAAQRPPLSRRMKSLTQIDRLEPIPKPCHTSLIYFTSISKFRKVHEIIRNHPISTQSILDVLVIPKPIGPRRILSGLYTALNRPSITSSPHSPGTPHYLTSNSLPLGTSLLGRLSPSISYRDVNDFDIAAGNHLMDESNHANNPVGENLNLVWPTPPQNSTPPGLRTPGTAPGTPAVPSPALLSHEALEYFSKAATENGGSSSTGVVLQSPDGRPQAMFFHHSLSSNRASHHLQGSHMAAGSANARSSNGRLRNGSRSSSMNRSVMREMINADQDPLPMTLAQQVMANAKDGNRTQSSSSRSSNISNAVSNDSSRTESSPARSDKNTLNQTIRSSNPRNSHHILGHPPSDSIFPHAMALARYEAISPKTPTLTYPEGLYPSSSQHRANSISSSQSMIMTPTHSDHSTAPITPNVPPHSYSGLSPLTKEQQQILLNPRPLPMLRMPSVPVSLPRSISVTFPSPRLPPGSKPTTTTTSETMTESKSSPAHDPPSSSPASRGEEPTGKLLCDPASSSATETSKSTPMSKSSSVLLAPSRRRSSVGEPMLARCVSKKRISRKPTTALVPPINVLIVEDNRINQTILTTFMRKKSVKFDVAMNGQEAVDKWRNGSFHLVLMDLQLPVKDGIEATKEIREAERAANINAFANTPPAVGSNTPPALLGTSRVTPHNVSVIIVALTASSLDVDREVALAAGCNDFLTKPVSLAWLEKKLLEWGSMAWLSGFSRPKLAPTITLNQSLPAFPTAPLAFHTDGRVAPKPASFTGPLAQLKAQEVADHLHLRLDKAQAAADRKRALVDRDKARAPGATTAATADDGPDPPKDIAASQPQTTDGPHPPPLPDDGRSSPRRDSSDDAPEGPSISLQMPTPERLGSF